MTAALTRAVTAAVIVFGVLGAPSPAGAHSSEGPPPSDFHPDVIGLTLRAPGVRAGLAPDEDRIELRSADDVTVVVLGYSGEPYLRVGPGGAFENRASPAVAMNRSRTPSGAGQSADPTAPPRWVRISDEPTVRWHDHRAHWMGGARPPVVREDPDRSHVVDRWTVPLRIDGRSAAVRGRTVWSPPPAAWRWYLLAAMSATAVAVAGRTRAVAVGCAVGLLAGETLHLVGTWPFSAASFGTRLGEVAPSLAAMGAAAFATRRTARRGLGGGAPALMVAGLFVAIAGGITDLGTLSHSWVPSRWEPVVARALVVWALGGGIGLFVVGARHLRVASPAPVAG